MYRHACDASPSFFNTGSWTHSLKLWEWLNHIILAFMLGPSLRLYVYKILCARIIELIYHTCHLCTSLRTYGIKAMSCGFSGGKQVINAASTKNTVEFVYSRQQKIYNFYLKDNNGKLWVVSSDYSFFSGCSYLVTIDPVLTESNNDLILIVETPILHFAGLKFSSRLRELTNHNRDFLCRQILNLEYPPKIPSKKNTCQIFLPLPYPPPPLQKKKNWNWKFQTQKILQSSLSLEIWSTQPGVELHYAFFIWKA